MNFLALFQMTQGELAVFLTALASVITGIFTTVFTWKNKKDY